MDATQIDDIIPVTQQEFILSMLKRHFIVFLACLVETSLATIMVAWVVRSHYGRSATALHCLDGVLSIIGIAFIMFALSITVPYIVQTSRKEKSKGFYIMISIVVEIFAIFNLHWQIVNMMINPCITSFIRIFLEFIVIGFVNALLLSAVTFANSRKTTAESGDFFHDTKDIF